MVGVGVEALGAGVSGATDGVLDFPFALAGLDVVVAGLAVGSTPSAENGVDGSIFRIMRNDAMTAVPPGK